ncbi:hypothetical protein PAMP_017271 [Pampus punctatissimus]
MADHGVDVSALPKEVRDQLAELDLELSEGWKRLLLLWWDSPSWLVDRIIRNLTGDGFSLLRLKCE